MTNCYLTPLEYKAAPTGQETASLLGNLLRIGSAGVLAGSAAVPFAAPSTVQLNIGDAIYIFDGASSEVVLVATAAAPGATSVICSALQYAHGANTVLCSDGLSGSLGQTLLNASSEIENICKQPLLSATYSETYQLNTMQCSLDNIGTLNVRTTRKPVTSIASAMLTTDVIAGQALALTTVKFNGQLLSIVGAGGAIPRSTEGVLDLSYTAGFVYTALPPRVKQAAIWITSDLLSDRVNPTGAAIDQQGKIHIQYRMLHETKGIFRVRAEEALKEYMVKVY